MKKILTIDIGGTFVKYALMNEDTSISKKSKVKTPLDCMDSLIMEIGNLFDEYKTEIDGIAISMPGKIDSKNGFAYTGGTLQYIQNISFVNILKERCVTEISIENDGKCAALAELWKGSLKEYTSSATIILGTGIGGGIILDGKLWKGSNFTAGEISCLNTDINNSNELSQIWAAVNGARALTASFAYLKGIDETEVTGEKVFEAVHNKDNDALNILSKFTSNLAAGIYNIQCVLDLECFAIGGGISEQPILIESVRSKLNEHFEKKSFLPINIPKIVKCEFGNDANLIGALYNHLINIREI